MFFVVGLSLPFGELLTVKLITGFGARGRGECLPKPLVLVKIHYFGEYHRFRAL